MPLMGDSKMARTFYMPKVTVEPLHLAPVEAMPDGPAKKFYLIKMLPADKKEAAKALSCAEIIAMLKH
jgi:hypothetical protein